MTTDLLRSCWPIARLGEAMRAAAHAVGMPTRPVDTPRPLFQDLGPHNETLATWVQSAADWLGLEAHATVTTYENIDAYLAQAGPTMVRFPYNEEPLYMVILRKRGKYLDVLTPTLVVQRILLRDVRDALCSPLEAPLIEQLDRLLADAGVPPKRWQTAMAAILREQLGTQYVAPSWMLRLHSSAKLVDHLRHAKIFRLVGAFVVLQVIETLMLLGAWMMVGQGALQGRTDFGWLSAWGLLLLTLVPFQVLLGWVRGTMAIRTAGIFKQRLLYGAMRLDPEITRREGAGQFLGRVLESEALEALVLSGGFMALISAIELVLMVGVLLAGTGGIIHALLLLIWIGLAVGLIVVYWRQRQEWTAVRLTMTNDLVERMVGHRTRLAQERPEHWHDGEDEMLSRYIELSRRVDFTNVAISFLPRGWMIIGLLGLVPGMFLSQVSPTGLAITIGGLLYAMQSLDRLTYSLASLTSAAISWERVKPLFDAAVHGQSETLPVAALPALMMRTESEQGHVLMEARNVSFRYRERASAVLQNCNIVIHQGDRMLLEGPSGGGKSTFASLLIGLRQPDTGTLLLEGMSWRTLGADGWRRRIVSAPQFHENHVFTETFAFNLLMGKRWPPEPGDFEEAELLCYELGLGELLQRMPGGMLQTVGETGWQLSHGERSRLFIARALLQGADLVIIDEGFAALDPENLRRALECVLRRAPALLVIAHP